MKTKEELNELKEEVEALNKKLQELTEEELAQVFGGFDVEFESKDRPGNKEINFYDNDIENNFNPKF